MAEPWPADTRAILHVDMDAFFVSVELLRQPELRGKPVIVGGSGDRGVVAAASYEARSFGIHSAMPSVQARRLCPEAVFLHGDHGAYRAVSERVMEVFRSVTPLVEPISLDEAFLDVSGAKRALGDPIVIASRLRTAVMEEEGLACSVGVADTKFIAKLASQEAKPRPRPGGPIPGAGVVAVWPGEELDFLHPLPVSRLWGVGPATQTRLERLGVVTVGDLAVLPEAALAGLGRSAAAHLHDLARGVDIRPVVPHHEPKSIGHEETFAHDRHDLDALGADALRLSDSVASRLRAAERLGRTITVKVRFSDFRTITRSTTMPAPTDAAHTILAEARRLLADVDPTPGVRLLGVSAGNLTTGGRQLSFDEAEGAWSSADDTIDEIRKRYGATAIGPATLLDPDTDTSDRPGNQPWGPRGLSG